MRRRSLVGFWPGAALLAPVLVALGLLAPGALSGQEVAGVALGPDGQPLPDVAVVLHRIGDMGASANILTATTDGEGRFRFQVETADSALHIVVLRHAERMYVGPPVRAGVERVTDYVVSADPTSEAGAVASALSGTGGAPAGTGGQAPGLPGTLQPRASGGGAGGGGQFVPGFSAQTGLIFLGLLALATVAILVGAAPRYRRRRTRELLVEIATLETELADDVPGEERTDLARRRDQLRERLAPTP